MKAADLERHLRAQIGRLYTNFNLNVSLGQLRAVKVFVVGPAQRPGRLHAVEPVDIAVGRGGRGRPGPNGSMRKIGLRRNGQIMSELDVYEFLVQGDKSKDVQLAAGDVVVFHPAGARVAVHGAIDTPAIYELKSRDEPLREVLRYAGGAPVLANPNRVQLERVDPTQAARRTLRRSLQPRRQRAAKAAARRRPADVARDFAAVRQCGDAARPRRAAAALPAHARHAHPRPDPGR